MRLRRRRQGPRAGPPPAVAMMPVAEHEEKVAQIKALVDAWKAGEDRTLAALRAEVGRLAGEVGAAREELAGQGRRCRACGGELEDE
jgi:hypothetical protein